MGRTPFIAGNWKMHGTVAEAVVLVDELAPLVAAVRGVRIGVAPPFTAIRAVADALRSSDIEVGGQNLHWEAKGAFTGEISAGMLVEAGCRFAIVGHSERRQFFGETDETVRRRTVAALHAGLTPVVCVGESLDEREAGKTLGVVGTQVRGALGDLAGEHLRKLAIAYEPVWAIGTGKTATPEQAQEVHAAIRGLLRELAGEEVAAAVPILYGGSVKADNAKELLGLPDVDGALVGGASLVAAGFAKIVAAAVG